MTLEQKAERIADLLLRVEMSGEEMKAWIQIIPYLTEEQINEFIELFEKQMRELEVFKTEAKDKLKVEILGLMKEKVVS